MALLRTIHVCNAYFGSAIGFFFNCFMLYVIVNTRQEELQKYSNILMQSTIVDIALNILNILICPIVLTAHQNLVLILHPITHFSSNFNLFLFYVWIVVTYLSITTVSICYLYRHRLVCRNKSFSISLHLLWDLLWIILGAAYSINIYYGLTVRNRNNFYIAEELAPLFGGDDGKVNPIGIIGKFDNYVYPIMAHTAINTIIPYSLTCWCGWRIYKYLKKHETLLENVLDIQRQLAKTLIIQAVIPIFTFAIPMCMMVVTVTFPASMPEFLSSLLGFMLAYIPMGNALCILLCVKPYREFARKLYRKLVYRIHIRKHQSTTLYVTPSMN
ncbi:hypothetical protein FO519_008445 [Halicephalobus sp. NKZ332]|nr:hypothetical protein FO519_008445 [Halicephalobus sp. NKZ332]